jgi:transcriptional regulator of heat shock response
VGSIGLIGPVRMDYSRVIPLVEYAAGLLTTMFEDR